jgi:hypothetical protein
MRPSASANQSFMPAVNSPYHPDYVGGLDSLANFWFKRIEFGDTGEKELPEMNLAGSADEAIFDCLQSRGVVNEHSCVDATFEDGLNTGLRVAAILTRLPFDAEGPLRKVLIKLVLLIEERRETVKHLS